MTLGGLPSTVVDPREHFPECCEECQLLRRVKITSFQSSGQALVVVAVGAAVLPDVRSIGAMTSMRLPH